MAIKCGHCTKVHETVPQVKLCSQIEKTQLLGQLKAGIEKAADLAKVQVSIPLTLDDVLGGDVNPDPKQALKTWSGEQDAKSAIFTSEIDAAKVEIGTPVAFVPEHRIKPNIAANVSMVKEFVTAAADAIKALPPKDPAAILAIYTNPTPSVQIIKAEVAALTVKTGQDLDLGMYQVEGIIYKVKFNKAGTQKYAEKLLITKKKVWDETTQEYKIVPKGQFIYVYGMMAILTSAHKMDEAAAKAFHDATKEKYGVDYGFCCVCGKLLTVKKSINAGIGPVCQSKL